MSTPTPKRLGLVGATGAVGEEFLRLMEERRFPLEELRLFGSERSRDQARWFGTQAFSVLELSPGCFAGLDVVFFAASEVVAREWAQEAVLAGALVIDNSSAFRMDHDKLLIVPEVNGHLLPETGVPQLIANPNCSTIQLAVALRPLLRDFGIESVHVATYQAVSGAGRPGQTELKNQLHAWTNEQPPPAAQTFPQAIAMNCIPQIGAFDASGFCTEELKIIHESKKILGAPDLRISAITVRVPVWNAHSEAVWVRLKKTVSREEVLTSLRSQSGLSVEPVVGKYATAVEISRKNSVFVGRIHQDLDDPQSWILWIVADNLRKGAALNGLQIAERIFDISPGS